MSRFLSESKWYIKFFYYCYVLSLYLTTLYFLSQCSFTQSWEENTEFPSNPCPHICLAFPIINILIRMMHEFQLMSLYWYNIITQNLGFILGFTFGVVHYMVLGKCIMTYGLPWCSAGKESTCNAGDPDSIPGSGRSPGERIWHWSSGLQVMINLLRRADQLADRC